VWLDGRKLSRHTTPGDSTEGWYYSTHLHALEIRVSRPGAHRVELRGVRYDPSRFVPQVVKAIDFDFELDAEGWSASHDLQPFAWEDGILTSRTTANDPYMVRTNLSVEAGRVKYLTVRMKLSPGAVPAAKWFWITQASPGFDEAKSVAFPVKPDGEWHEYRVSMGEHAQWTGTITGLRLDPTSGGADVEVAIDWIRGS